MNVLITGGYGFIGSYVAERFYNEGHTISIIDNLSSGIRSNVTIPHKFYQLSVEDLKCDEVIQSIHPDLVIHLAGHVLGLVNILGCSSRAKVSRFIYTSSAAVYGHCPDEILTEQSVCNPMSLHGVNQMIGEYYCTKWLEIYGLQTLIFRLSYVYGPREGDKGEGSVVSTCIKRLQDNKEVQIYGDGEQTRDFIYVADVVDAIYRGANSWVTGIYNISTNKAYSLNQFISLLGSMKPIVKISNATSRSEDIVRSRLDNTRAKQAFDWVPIYSLEEGLDLTFKWYSKEDEDKKLSKLKENKKRKEAVKWWVLIKPFVENILVFLVVISITLLSSELLLYTDLDFKLMYVILLGIVYGTR